jgi:hypothetical protein
MGAWSGIYKGLMAAEQAKAADADREIRQKQFELLERQFEETKLDNRRNYALKLADKKSKIATNAANFGSSVSYLKNRNIDPEKLSRLLVTAPQEIPMLAKTLSGSKYADLSGDELNGLITLTGDFSGEGVPFEEAFGSAMEVFSYTTDTAGKFPTAFTVGKVPTVGITTEEANVHKDQNKFFDTAIKNIANTSIANLSESDAATATAISKDLGEYEKGNAEPLLRRYGQSAFQILNSQMEQVPSLATAYEKNNTLAIYQYVVSGGNPEDLPEGLGGTDSGAQASVSPTIKTTEPKVAADKVAVSGGTVPEDLNISQTDYDRISRNWSILSAEDKMKLVERVPNLNKYFEMSMEPRDNKDGDLRRSYELLTGRPAPESLFEPSENLNPSDDSLDRKAERGFGRTDYMSGLIEPSDLTGMGEAVVEQFTDEAVAKRQQWLKDNVTSLDRAFKDTAMQLKDGIEDLYTAAAEGTPGAIKAAEEALKDTFTMVGESNQQLAEVLETGLSSTVANLKESAKDFGDSAKATGQPMGQEIREGLASSYSTGPIEAAFAYLKELEMEEQDKNLREYTPSSLGSEGLMSRTSMAPIGQRSDSDVPRPWNSKPSSGMGETAPQVENTLEQIQARVGTVLGEKSKSYKEAGRLIREASEGKALRYGDLQKLINSVKRGKSTEAKRVLLEQLRELQNETVGK